MVADKSKSGRSEETKVELEEKVLHINRCSKVVKGGRKFSFSALVIVGDRKNKIGVGFAKALEVPDAIRKASENAKKSLVKVENENDTIPFEVLEKADGACVMLKPATRGTGVVAGSNVRAVLELAGYHDVVAKSIGSSNPMNQVRATIKALNRLSNRKEVLATRLGEV